MHLRVLAVAAIAAMAFAGPAEAQQAGPDHATTADLNLRSGAGTGFGVIAVIPRGQPVQLHGCNPAVTWCNVSFEGTTGWVSARYLTPRPAAAIVTPEASQPPDGTVIVSGMLTPEGIQCQALRGEEGRLYTLDGNIEPFHLGDRVEVRGKVAEMSICMQGTTIIVESIEQAP